MNDNPFDNETAATERQPEPAAAPRAAQPYGPDHHEPVDDVSGHLVAVRLVQQLVARVRV